MAYVWYNVCLTLNNKINNYTVCAIIHNVKNTFKNYYREENISVELTRVIIKLQFNLKAKYILLVVYNIYTCHHKKTHTHIYIYT